MVPELLFHPLDVALNQAGLAQTVADAVQAVPSHLHQLLYSNVVLTGGMANCLGFQDRVYRELRPLVASDYALGVHTPEDPTLSAWLGGSLLGSSPQFGSVAMTKADYEEHGAGRLAEQ
jgi:actin-related protein 6